MPQSSLPGWLHRLSLSSEVLVPTIYSLLVYCSSWTVQLCCLPFRDSGFIPHWTTMLKKCFLIVIFLCFLWLIYSATLANTIKNSLSYVQTLSRFLQNSELFTWVCLYFLNKKNVEGRSLLCLFLLFFTMKNLVSSHLTTLE